MQFKPNFDLLRTTGSKELISIAGARLCVAIFHRENKTLVCMCDDHKANIAFDMSEMCLSDNFSIKPDVLLCEMENVGFERKFSSHGYQDSDLTHAAGLAAKKNIPLVFMDLSREQMVGVVNSRFPNNQIADSDLHNILMPNHMEQQHEQYIWLLQQRDRFMLQNIAAALNKWDSVFVIFGGAHFANQRLVLEDMMGKPEYITKIKNMRGDFSDVKIEPIKLCEFEMVKNEDKKS